MENIKSIINKINEIKGTWYILIFFQVVILISFVYTYLFINSPIFSRQFQQSGMGAIGVFAIMVFSAIGALITGIIGLVLLFKLKKKNLISPLTKIKNIYKIILFILTILMWCISIFFIFNMIYNKTEATCTLAGKSVHYYNGKNSDPNSPSFLYDNSGNNIGTCGGFISGCIANDMKTKLNLENCN